MAQARVPFQGLPARICWLGYGERARAGLAFNELVRTGEVARPDRHRARPPRRGLGGVTQPRDRGDARRLGRRRGLAAPQRPREHGGRRDLGLDPPRRRRRDRLQPARRDGGRRRRHGRSRRGSWSASSRRTRRWASFATSTRATSGRSRSPASGASTSRCRRRSATRRIDRADGRELDVGLRQRRRRIGRRLIVDRRRHLAERPDRRDEQRDHRQERAGGTDPDRLVDADRRGDDRRRGSGRAGSCPRR